MKQKMDHQRNCKSNDQDIARKPPAYQFTVAVLPLLIFQHQSQVFKTLRQLFSHSLKKTNHHQYIFFDQKQLFTWDCQSRFLCLLLRIITEYCSLELFFLKQVQLQFFNVYACSFLSFIMRQTEPDFQCFLLQC